MALANVPASAAAVPVSAAGVIFPAAAALALKQGQVLDARVVQMLGGNAVRLNIEGVLIDALAGARLAPGALLRMRVEGDGPTVRLTIVPPSQAKTAPLPSVQATPAQSAPAVAASSSLQQPAPAPAQQTAPIATPGASVAPALQRLFGDVQRALAQPGGTITQSQREAAARILNLALPPSSPTAVASGTPAAPAVPAAQAPLSLPPQALAQLVTGMAQVLAQDGDGAADLVRQAAARLFSLTRAAAAGMPAAPAPSTVQPLPAGSAVRALFASADLILAGNPKEVPAPVREALEALTTLRASVTPQTGGEALRHAVAASGVFAEAHIVQWAVPQPAGDMKLALFLVRDAVRAWLGEGDSKTRPAADKPAPPARGAETAQPARAEPPTGAAREMARVLLAQTDAALSRLRVAQVAAFPDRAEPGAAVSTDQNGSLHVALPIANGDRPGFLHMQIDPDGGGDADAGGSGGWRVRFSLDVEPAGPAQAVLGFKAGEVSVSLWAERGETAAVLAAHEPLLRDMLKQAGLEAGMLSIRRGKPAAQIWRNARLLDRRS